MGNINAKNFKKETALLDSVFPFAS